MRMVGVVAYKRIPETNKKNCTGTRPFFFPLLGEAIRGPVPVQSFIAMAVCQRWGGLVYPLAIHPVASLLDVFQ